jgi:hypothetical protein
MVVDIDQIELKTLLSSIIRIRSPLSRKRNQIKILPDTSIAEAITDDANDSPLPNITVGNLKIDNAKVNESIIDASIWILK